MSDNFEKLGSQIPDFWYDLYARIFPGLYLCFGMMFVLGFDISSFDFGDTAIITLLAYISGHAQQPWASSSCSRLFKETIPENDSAVTGRVFGWFSGVSRRWLFRSNFNSCSNSVWKNISEKRSALFSSNDYEHTSREALVLAKVHAEIASMFGFRNISVLLSVASLGGFVFQNGNVFVQASRMVLFVVFSVCFQLAAYDRACAYNWRINNSLKRLRG